MPIPARKSKLSWQLNVLEGVSGFQPFQADLPQCSKKQLDYLKLVVDGLLIQDGLPAYEQFISCSTKNSYTIKQFFPAGMMSKEAVYICQLTWFCQYCVSVHYSFVSDYQTCLQQPMNAITVHFAIILVSIKHLTDFVTRKAYSNRKNPTISLG